MSRQTNVTALNFNLLTRRSIHSEALRHVTSSRSPLAELVSDPILLRSLTKRETSRSTSRRRNDGKRREHDADRASRVLSVVLAEEEREVQNLRAQLIVMAEQLKGSVRNVADAESRAQTAQSREREMRTRLQQVEQAKHQADLEITRQAEEMKRYRLQVDTLTRQLANVEVDMRALEKEKDESEDKARDAKDALRQYKQFIRDAQARDEGLEQGRRLGLQRGYSSGRLSGLKLGRQEGFEEGYEYGRQQGYRSGETNGRREERVRAKHMMDPYIATHKLQHKHEDDDDDSVSTPT